MPTTRGRLWSAPGIEGRIRWTSRRATASPSSCSCRWHPRWSGASSNAKSASGARVVSATPACAERIGERMKKLELKPGSVSVAQLMPLVGVVLLLLAGYEVWTGLQVQSGIRLKEAAEAARAD